MPLPLVAVVASSGEFAPDAKTTIVASCQGVIGEARCVDAEDPLAPAARYLALVEVFGEGRLRVKLTSRADDRPRGERDLAFLAPNLGLEHWNSAGLVVAALVVDAEQAVAVIPEPAPSFSKPCPACPADLGMWVRVGLAGATSPGFDFGSWRIGPSLNLAFGSQTGFLYPVLTARWLGSPGEKVRSDVTSAALGLGGRLIRHRDVLELNLEAAAVAETLLVALKKPGQTEQRFRVRYGARLGLTSSLKLASPFHAYAGVELTWLGRRAIVEVAGERLGTELRYFPGFEGGLRLIF